ncbi:hypothetical protein SEVIR_8G001650v4 [Setaria viridis]|uniref:Uncharacterized protein n=1 Tax=Setaria italica TaxID=4555 RepID=K3YFI1_SETIT
MPFLFILPPSLLLISFYSQMQTTSHFTPACEIAVIQP